jgi:hypothetical protein
MVSCCPTGQPKSRKVTNINDPNMMDKSMDGMLEVRQGLAAPSSAASSMLYSMKNSLTHKQTLNYHLAFNTDAKDVSPGGQAPQVEQLACLSFF